MGEPANEMTSKTSSVGFKAARSGQGAQVGISQNAQLTHPWLDPAMGSQPAWPPVSSLGALSWSSYGDDLIPPLAGDQVP